MKYCRLYTGQDGQSHFEDVEVSLRHPQGAGMRSEIMTSSGFFFRRSTGAAAADWQNAPRRQFVIVTMGAFDVAVGDGARRRFGRGDVLLAEDTSGKGHLTSGADNQPWEAVFVPLD
jgi:hypothetical protein